MTIHPSLHRLLAHENVRELNSAAERLHRAHTPSRRGRRMVRRLRAPLTLSRAPAAPTHCR